MLLILIRGKDSQNIFVDFTEKVKTYIFLQIQFRNFYTATVSVLLKFDHPQFTPTRLKKNNVFKVNLQSEQQNISISIEMRGLTTLFHINTAKGRVLPGPLRELVSPTVV